MNPNQAQATGPISTHCRKEASGLAIKSEVDAETAQPINKKRIQTQRVPLAELCHSQTPGQLN